MLNITLRHLVKEFFITLISTADDIFKVTIAKNIFFYILNVMSMLLPPRQLASRTSARSPVRWSAIAWQGN
jgi:hypothetical protein